MCQCPEVPAKRDPFGDIKPGLALKLQKKQDKYCQLINLLTQLLEEQKQTKEILTQIRGNFL